MMLTGAQALPPVAERTMFRKSRLNAITRCGIFCASSMITAAAFGTGASITLKFCGKPVNFMICATMSRQSDGRFAPNLLAATLTGEPS
jgi:hypothetical protein